MAAPQDSHPLARSGRLTADENTALNGLRQKPWPDDATSNPASQMLEFLTKVLSTMESF